MSRRCDREGVPWPRTFWSEWSGHGFWAASRDPLEQRRAHREHVQQPETFHCAVYCTAHDVMKHLRERPVLPPWWTQEMLDDTRELASEWRAMFLELTQGE